LWDEPIPGAWEREDDPQLLGGRYRRGDVASPRAGEHRIEHEILCSHFDRVQWGNWKLVDGVNAMCLVRDSAGGRGGNVEADLFLLLESAGRYRCAVCEVKEGSNTPWYAVVENVRQLKLLCHSTAARRLFQKRNPSLANKIEFQPMGLVVAPEEYYRRAGQKAGTVPHVREFLRAFRKKTGIDMDVAAWNAESARISSI
jgi:hypothetical protein